MVYAVLVAVILTWIYVIYSVMKIKAGVDEMRHTILDVLKEKIQESDRRLEGWKDTIEKFDDSVKLSNEMLEILKQKPDWISCDDRIPELPKEGEQE